MPCPARPGEITGLLLQGGGGPRARWRSLARPSGPETCRRAMCWRRA
ncbi:hypothetical protein ACFQU7_09050 [Pseudoroseomonas wenyumeiae]